MNRLISQVSIFLLVLLWLPEIAPAAPCPCDADVNNDGVVNLVDGVCIAECRGGNCACCLSSCDVNCDGVVDAGDFGDNPLVDVTPWLCQFNGGTPATCCPGPTGACCQLDTGACTENQFAADCSAANQSWNEGLTCAAAACPTLPVGACCDLDFGTCTENQFAADCSAANQSWNEGLTCAAAACPTPPTGACCNVGNGHCRDVVVAAACAGPDDVWTQATSCATAGCAVPPQNPCPCDADVDNNGVVDINDGVCISDCRGGNCACCLSSCDVNCNGVVDAGDFGDNPLVDVTPWLCQFNGGTPATCCPGPTGACCQLDTGTCTENQFAADCSAANQSWNEGLTCAAAACPTPPVGACCDLDFGTCTENQFAADCSAANQSWNEGLTCAAAACPTPPTGACCNVGNGHCQDVVVAAACAGPDDVWTQATSCATAGCAVPPQNPCPCDADVDNNGVVDINDGVCIANCRGGDCACCLSSCDVNCDGVVDAGDFGDNPIVDVTPWLCQFNGGTPATCCPDPTGACCQLDTGTCTENQFAADCSAANQSWNEGLTCAAACSPPMAVATGEVAKTNRYLRFSAPGGVGTEVIRIKIVSLNSFATPSPNVLYVGPPFAAPEEDTTQPDLTFTAAPLQCGASAHNWSSEGVISVYGAELIPGSTYQVQRALSSCPNLESDESCWSAPLTITTARFADVAEPFFLNSGDSQPDFKDITAVVQKFLGEPTAPIKAVAQLSPNVVFPDRPVDFKDMSVCVQSFLTAAYADMSFASGPCICPSTVICGATSCIVDGDCGTGLCIDGACADECGRCSP